VGTVLYRWVLAICSLCVLLAFHKHGSVGGKSIWRVQVPSYVGLFAVSALASYWLAIKLDHATKKYVDEMATAISDKLKPFLIREPRTSESSTGKPEQPKAEVTPVYLSAQCSLPKDFSSCEIKCSVHNPHDVAISDVSVGFNGIYPYQTRLAAGTETHMSIKKQETLPLPMAGGYIDQNLQAFSVEIPLVPQRASLSFTLWSRSDDNQKTCTYLKTTIRAEQRKKIDQLVAMKHNLNADMMESLQTKKASLFVPGYFMSAEGRRKVEFVTNQEEKNAKDFSDLYDKAGKTIPAKRCLIPIFAAENNDGSIQYFANAPPMMTWVFNRESMKMTTRPDGKGGTIETDPHPPENYVCEDQ